MPKFSPGDPVWLRSVNIPGNRPNLLPPGEYAAVVIDEPVPYWVVPWGTSPIYALDAEGYGCCAAREEYLRPRRDDYQQHEGLGSRDELVKPATPDLTEESVEELFLAVRFCKEEAK